MKISTLSLTASAVLLLLAASLASVVIWSNKQTQDVQLTSAKIEDVKQDFLIQVRRSIDDYLATGNASQLDQAKLQLTGVIQKLAHLDNSFADDLTASIPLFIDEIEGKYRPAGKLAASPRELLVQAEKEMLFNNARLASYALQGYSVNPELSERYLQLCQSLPELVYQLSQLTQAYFFNGEAKMKPLITDHIHYLQEWREQLMALALIGLYEKGEVDEFSLGDDEPERYEIGEDYKGELESLTARYSKEFANTEKIFDSKKIMQKDLSTQVAGIESKLLEMAAWQDHLSVALKSKMQQVLYMVVSVLTLFSLLSFTLQQRMIVAPLKRLNLAFRQLTETNTREKLQINSSCETGQIAQYFNNLLDNFEQEDEVQKQKMVIISQSLVTLIDRINTLTYGAGTTEQAVVQTQGQTAQIKSLMDNMSELSAQIESSAELTSSQMKKSQSEAVDLLGATEETQHKVEQCQSSLRDLGASVNQVATIIDVVSNIAEQTNLLALNAAIEAARAGEHGRGFAVVADEVRNLSKRTQDSLQQISNILSQLHDANNDLTDNMSAIDQATSEQQQQTQSMLELAQQVQHDAIGMAKVAKNGATSTQKQATLLVELSKVMDELVSHAQTAKSQSEDIADNVAQGISVIENSLGINSHKP